MTSRYYEAHITMEGDPTDVVRKLSGDPRFNPNGAGGLPSFMAWKFSAIHGDSNLGTGLKCYLTRQANIRIGDDRILGELKDVAQIVADRGIKVVRRKVEIVIWDDRSAKVQCLGMCPECVE